MAKTYSAGGVAHGAKYWRLTIDVRESDGERRRLTKTTKIACAKSGTRGRSAALTALRQWCDEPIRQAEAEDSVGLGTPTADYAEDFIARHSEMAPPPGRSTCAPCATCALRATLAAALASAREAQRERIRGFGRWSPSPFICENPLTGAWLSPNVLSSRWSALSAAMNWLGTQSDPVIFHNLRHTFATVSIAQGCDVMSLASILDHKDPSMTMKVYATALAAPKRAAMDRLGDFYGLIHVLCPEPTHLPAPHSCRRRSGVPFGNTPPGPLTTSTIVLSAEPSVERTRRGQSEAQVPHHPDGRT